jgi:hypothetical protein
MSDTVFGDDAFEQSYVSVSLVAAFFGTVASIITIIIIRRMPKTGHLLLLLYMSYFELGYDLVSFTLNVHINHYLTVFSFTIALPTAIIRTIISNWMMFIAFYVVMYQKPFEVFGWKRIIFFTSVIPALICTSMYIIGEATSDPEMIHLVISQINNIMRMILIGLNFIFISVIIYKITAFTSSSRTLT